MRKLSKGQTIALSIAGIGAATLLGVGGVQAAQDTTSGTSLVDKIASHFNLNKADVQQVFDQNRTEMKAKHAQAEADRLQKAVDAGTISSVQKDLIVAKQAELKTYMETLKDKTDEERRTAMKSKMDELKQWATDNKIPENLLRSFGGRGGHGPGDRPDGPPPTDTTNKSTHNN
jgi:hypothetical protein